MNNHRFFSGILAAGIVLAALGTAQAAEPAADTSADEMATPAGTATGAEARGTPVKVAGLRVFIDPKTGRLRPPTDAEAAALSTAVASAYSQRPVENAPTVFHADGSVSIRLGSRHLLHNVARIDAHGELETVCVQGAGAAHDLLSPPAGDEHIGEAAE